MASPEFQVALGLSLWLVPNATQRHLIQGVFPQQPETRPVSPTSYPSITPHITLLSSRDATADTLLRALPPTLRRTIPVAFQALTVGDHYFRSVFLSAKETLELIALQGHIVAMLGKDGVSLSAPAFPHMSVCYIADEDGDAERERAAEELRAAGAVVEDLEGGGVALRCGDSEQEQVLLSGFEGTEVWVVRCDGPVQDWQVLQKVSTRPDIACE